MKHIVNGQLVDMTAEEISEQEARNTVAEQERQAEETARQAQADLKASAKAKLVAGEALTQEEADTIVL